jgi:hypothetical protein
MDILLTLYSLYYPHNILHWIIVYVAIFAIIKFGVGALRNAEFNSIDRGLALGFSGLMILETVIGFLELLLMLEYRNKLIGSNDCATGDCLFLGNAVLHGVIMLIATTISCLPLRWKNMENTIRFRKNILVILISLGLILFGIAALGSLGKVTL